MMDPSIKDLNSWKILVLEPERENILYDMHNTINSWHSGNKKTTMALYMPTI